MLDDLSDGLLQAVGSQHELLAGLKDGGCAGGAGGAGRCRGVAAGGRGGWRGPRGRRGYGGRGYGGFALLLLLGDGGRRGGHDAGRLGLLVERLQQRVQLLLQHPTLEFTRHTERRSVT